MLVFVAARGQRVAPCPTLEGTCPLLLFSPTKGVVMHGYTNARKALDELINRFPCTFLDPPVPLKIGIRQDILSCCRDIVPSRRRADKALRIWTERPEYQACLIAGAPRIGLIGTSDGPPVSENEEAVAKSTLLQQV